MYPPFFWRFCFFGDSAFSLKMATTRSVARRKATINARDKVMLSDDLRGAIMLFCTRSEKSRTKITCSAVYASVDDVAWHDFYLQYPHNKQAWFNIWTTSYHASSWLADTISQDPLFNESVRVKLQTVMRSMQGKLEAHDPHLKIGPHYKRNLRVKAAKNIKRIVSIAKASAQSARLLSA